MFYIKGFVRDRPFRLVAPILVKPYLSVVHIMIEVFEGRILLFAIRAVKAIVTGLPLAGSATRLTHFTELIGTVKTGTAMDFLIRVLGDTRGSHQNMKPVSFEKV
jgi:hypothetical protein